MHKKSLEIIWLCCCLGKNQNQDCGSQQGLLCETEDILITLNKKKQTVNTYITQILNFAIESFCIKSRECKIANVYFFYHGFIKLTTIKKKNRPDFWILVFEMCLSRFNVKIYSISPGSNASNMHNQLSLLRSTTI